jgi:hypothetical protein
MPGEFLVAKKGRNLNWFKLNLECQQRGNIFEKHTCYDIIPPWKGYEHLEEQVVTKIYSCVADDRVKNKDELFLVDLVLNKLDEIEKALTGNLDAQVDSFLYRSSADLSSLTSWKSNLICDKKVAISYEKDKPNDIKCVTTNCYKKEIEKTKKPCQELNKYKFQLKINDLKHMIPEESVIQGDDLFAFGVYTQNPIYKINKPLFYRCETKNEKFKTVLLLFFFNLEAMYSDLNKQDEALFELNSQLFLPIYIKYIQNVWNSKKTVEDSQKVQNENNQEKEKNVINILGNKINDAEVISFPKTSHKLSSHDSDNIIMKPVIQTEIHEQELEKKGKTEKQNAAVTLISKPNENLVKETSNYSQNPHATPRRFSEEASEILNQLKEKKKYVKENSNEINLNKKEYNKEAYSKRKESENDSAFPKILIIEGPIEIKSVENNSLLTIQPDNKTKTRTIQNEMLILNTNDSQINNQNMTVSQKENQTKIAQNSLTQIIPEIQIENENDLIEIKSIDKNYFVMIPSDLSAQNIREKITIVSQNTNPKVNSTQVVPEIIIENGNDLTEIKSLEKSKNVIIQDINEKKSILSEKMKQKTNSTKIIHEILIDDEFKEIGPIDKNLNGKIENVIQDHELNEIKTEKKVSLTKVIPEIVIEDEGDLAELKFTEKKYSASVQNVTQANTGNIIIKSDIKQEVNLTKTIPEILIEDGNGLKEIKSIENNDKETIKNEVQINEEHISKDNQSQEKKQESNLIKPIPEMLIKENNYLNDLKPVVKNSILTIHSDVNKEQMTEEKLDNAIQNIRNENNLIASMPLILIEDDNGLSEIKYIEKNARSTKHSDLSDKR